MYFLDTLTIHLLHEPLEEDVHSPFLLAIALETVVAVVAALQLEKRETVIAAYSKIESANNRATGSTSPPVAAVHPDRVHWLGKELLRAGDG